MRQPWAQPVCRLDGQAMGEFGDALPGLRLETLDLGENVLKELGVEYVATARCLRELKELRLDRCEIPLAGARPAGEEGGLHRRPAAAGRRPQPLRPGRAGHPAGA